MEDETEQPLRRLTSLLGTPGPMQRIFESVVSSLIAAYVISLVATTVAIAALHHNDGMGNTIAAAFVWALAFLVIGGVVAFAAVTVWIMADEWPQMSIGPQTPMRRLIWYRFCAATFFTGAFASMGLSRVSTHGIAVKVALLGLALFLWGLCFVALIARRLPPSQARLRRDHRWFYWLATAATLCAIEATILGGYVLGRIYRGEIFYT